MGLWVGLSASGLLVAWMWWWCRMSCMAQGQIVSRGFTRLDCAEAWCKACLET